MSSAVTSDNSTAWITLLLPTSLIFAAFAGRILRKWYESLNHRTKANVNRTLEKYWKYLLAFLLFIGITYVVTNLHKVPITGRTCFMSYTVDESRSIGEVQAHIMYHIYERRMHRDESPLSLKVKGVISCLISGNPELRSGINWQVYVINADFENTFVFPSGHIFFFDGLMPVLKNVDQMAIVIGHEMAHVVLLHGYEKISLEALIDYVLLVCTFVIWFLVQRSHAAMLISWVCSNILQLSHYPLSRIHEREADKVGVMFAARGCFDYREGSEFWKNVASQDSEKQFLSTPVWWRSHPRSLERAENLAKLEGDAQRWRMENPACPPLKDKMFLTEIVYARLNRNTRNAGKVIFLRFLWSFYHIFGLFMFGAAVTHLLTNIPKYTIGRLRPHFFAICQPNWSKVKGNSSYIVEDICAGEDKDLIYEARLSFPSGHSSMAMYCAFVFMFYLEKRLKSKNFILFCPTLQLAAFAMAFYTCLSRISDYKHHWSDVLVGAILGIGIAYAISLRSERLRTVSLLKEGGFSPHNLLYEVSIQGYRDEAFLLMTWATKVASLLHRCHGCFTDVMDASLLHRCHGCFTASQMSWMLHCFTDVMDP
ncbi:metalloendopeptidase [Bulinus truncatus]|nr:metalloendopeptidase [Bulinus truncatus]